MATSTNPFTRFVQDRYLLSAGLLVALAAAILWPYRNFVGDDSYIAFRFAHNLAEGAGFSFNPGEPTYGSTAPLWVMMVSALSRTGLDVPDSAHLLNAVFIVGLVLVFFALACRYLGRGAAAVIATVLLVLDPWFVRWAMSGLENAFTLFLLVGALFAQLSYRNSGRVSWIAPLMAGLAGLCRPEMLLFCGILLADTILLERRRRLANIAAFFLISSAIFLPWFAYALASFGSVIPNTVTAKISSDHLFAIERVVLYFGSFWVFQAVAVLAVIAIASLRHSAVACLRESWTIWLLPAAWAVLLPLFYIAGGAPVAGRYMMFALPCYLLIGVAALKVTWERYPKAAAAGVIATVALLVAVQYRYSWYITRWPQGIDPFMIEAAQTLKAVSDSDDTVAANQIGALGYFSDRRVLDTYGLVSPEVFPYLQVGDEAVLKYVCERGVQYLFLSESIDELSRLNPSYGNVTLIRTFHVHREGASAASALRTYHLYETNWDGNC